MSTIKDVAEKAGVAISTVSNVVNGKGNVSDKTMEKAHDIINELDYEVDHIARCFRGGYVCCCCIWRV